MGVDRGTEAFSHRRRSHSLPTTLAAIATIGVLAAGCGSDNERSVDAFCSTMRSEKARILEQFEASTGDGQVESLEDALVGLGASAQALGELRTYFNKLARVAPGEIRTEIEIVAEAYDDQLEAMGDAVGDPLGGLGSVLVSSLTTSGQLAAVDSFARENCGEGV